MDVKLLRIDERLAHGQVITSWSKQLVTKKILIIDDDLANDSFMCDVMKMSAPTGVDVDTYTVEDACKILNEDTSNVSTIILFKDIKVAKKLADNNYEFKNLNIGNIGSAPGRKGITNRVFMSLEEIEIVKDLIEKGISVYLQMLPSDSVVDIKKLI